MLCVRCAHQFPPRADRCLRCFALNPQNRPGPIAPSPKPVEAEAFALDTPAPPLPPALALPLDSTEPLATFDVSLESDPPARRLDLGEFQIHSDPPLAPTGLRVDSSPPSAPPPLDPQLAVTDPAPGPVPSLPPPPAPAPAPMLQDAPAQAIVTPLAAAADLPFSLPPAPRHEPQPALPRPPAQAYAAPEQPRPDRPTHLQQCTTWIIDALLLSGCATSFVALAVWVLGRGKLAPAGSQSLQSWADQLVFSRGLVFAWLAVACALALSYSWLFSALGGRTPGMLITRLRLERDGGGPLSPGRALGRALLSLPSAGLGLLGFWLALLDPRGQTLHDKLAGVVMVREG